MLSEEKRKLPKELEPLTDNLVNKIHELVNILRKFPEEWYLSQLGTTIMHILEDLGMNTEHKVAFLAAIIQELMLHGDFDKTWPEYVE